MINSVDKITGILLTQRGKTFTYEYYEYFNTTYRFNSYIFNIWDEKATIDKTRANYTLLIMNDGLTLKVIDAFMNDYEGNGIAIAILLKSKELFGKRIISSSNKKEYRSFVGESRWSTATDNIWQPLVLQGLATYNNVGDYFILS